MNDEELRELDAEVAVKVLGWRYTHGPSESNPSHGYECVFRPPEEAAKYLRKYVSKRPRGRPLYTKLLPHYSTDIAAAWQVVEKMRERGMSVVVSTENRPHVIFGDVGSWTFADTVPLAICLAALAPATGAAS